MYVCARYSHVCAHSTEHVIRGQLVDVGSLSHVGQEDRTQVVMPDGRRLDPLSRPTADLVFNAFWVETVSTIYSPRWPPTLPPKWDYRHALPRQATNGLLYCLEP